MCIRDRNTTESKNASTAASLDKTTASQKDRATESPKVTTVVQSTPFPSHFTQNVTGIFTSSGEIRSLQDSSKAKPADNQVGLIVGITVGVVLVLVISGALISYCLLPKSYSCSKDPEKGVYNSVNDTEPCPVAIKGNLFNYIIVCVLSCDYYNNSDLQWAIPENIHTIPRTALRISEGEGGFTIMEF